MWGVAWKKKEYNSALADQDDYSEEGLNLPIIILDCLLNAKTTYGATEKNVMPE